MMWVANAGHSLRPGQGAIAWLDSRIGFVKKYLVVRWRKRWGLIPGSAVPGAIWVYRSLQIHDGKALNIVILLVCFDIVGILFPFHWGGEDWGKE
jgi:hypothetical protein